MTTTNPDTFVAYSENITMTNLDMNSTSNSQWSTVNTDGTDTWNSKDVFISNWTVTCGDVSTLHSSHLDSPPTPGDKILTPTTQDCIAVKGNSTNIQVSNVHCYESGCATIGSLGNPSNVADYVENVTFDNIKCTHSSNAAWIKTYSGSGRVRNITFSNIVAENVNQPIYVTSCIWYVIPCGNLKIITSPRPSKNGQGKAISKILDNLRRIKRGKRKSFLPRSYLHFLEY